MRGFFRLIEDFKSDQRGAFAVLFGLLSIVLVAVAGAVVDFTSLQLSRGRAQEALDAAALALQPKIYTETDSEIKQQALALVTERLGDKSVKVKLEQATTDTTTGTLHLQAQIIVPTTFVGLVGVPDIPARLVAEATRKKLHVEVGMVLDNSGSMGSYSRMDNLKQAAKAAVNDLFDGATSDTSVYIGIVPFTELVNVGTSNASASWMDRTGAAEITRENFDNNDNSSDTFNGPIDRIALMDSMSNVNWGGCVEARKAPYDTNDTAPSASNPDTLFTPAFAPDTPDGTSYSDYLNDTPSQCPSVSTCSCTRSGSWWSGYSTSCTLTNADGSTQSGSNVCSCGSNWSYNYYTRTYTQSCSLLPPRERQERMCKYNGKSASYGGFNGPNSDCPSAAILPLTNQKQTILDEINSMYASGGTNIHQGVIWGFRVMSPTAPFTQGNAYDSATFKTLIVMTDGENTFYPQNDLNGSNLYSAYGWLYNGRIGNMGDSKSTLQANMNTKTLASCTAAKNAGIEIYTIGLDPPNSTTRNMLTQCASGADHAYFPTDPSELTPIFQEIAKKLSDLRLSR